MQKAAPRGTAFFRANPLGRGSEFQISPQKEQLVLNPSLSLPQARPLVAESDGAYPAIQLNDRFRVIVCRDGIQWVLQARNRATETIARGVWRGRSYCRSRDALTRCCDDHAGAINPAAVAALRALPERIAPVSAAGMIAVRAPREAVR
jgi:hypothetical protein